MKFIKVILLLIIFSLLLSSCNSNVDSNNAKLNSPSVLSTDNQDKSNSTDNQKVNSNYGINKLFFKDVTTKKQYLYTGDIWDQEMSYSEGSEYSKYHDYFNSEGLMAVEAILTVTRIAKLNSGIIYEMEFSVTSVKNKDIKKDETHYVWVTKDNIYKISPQDSIEVYAENLVKENKLPTADKVSIRCSNKDIKFSDGSWETEITFKNNTGTYLSSHNSGHFSHYVWKADTGLSYYSWGYGAMREGIKLNFVKVIN